MSRYEELLGLTFPEIEHSYGWRDTVLYALGVGAGEDPLDDHELDLVFEERLSVLPSMAVTLAYPGFWYRNLPTGLDFMRVVHASEHLQIHHRLPVAATVVARPRITAIYDKGEGRGALVESEREIRRKQDRLLLATVRQTAFCRADGGLGGRILAPPAPHEMPARAPDVFVDMPTSRRAALIYRLSGDDNPLHIDPGFAQGAGFAAPILHGLASYGHVARAIRRTFCDGPDITLMGCRFVGVVYPGETLSIELWREGEQVSFRAFVGDRRVIDNGEATLGNLASGEPHVVDARPDAEHAKVTALGE
ncbi:MaoC/PaaZ C-terminal domain-containing protein [Mesorhizobium sp. 1B3]|uniref:MaoC/PaaZ C-terminal domain-containing protein n=1 Tax=Mesorhizobium sp. 1B3 TaxID=3243599 RepID=UPI003D970143